MNSDKKLYKITMVFKSGYVRTFECVEFICKRNSATGELISIKYKFPDMVPFLYVNVHEIESVWQE